MSKRWKRNWSPIIGLKNARGRQTFAPRSFNLWFVPLLNPFPLPFFHSLHKRPRKSTLPWSLTSKRYQTWISENLFQFPATTKLAQQELPQDDKMQESAHVSQNSNVRITGNDAKSVSQHRGSTRAADKYEQVVWAYAATHRSLTSNSGTLSRKLAP